MDWVLKKKLIDSYQEDFKSKAPFKYSIYKAKQKWKDYIDGPKYPDPIPRYIVQVKEGKTSILCYICRLEAPCMVVEQCGVCETCGKAFLE